MRIPKITSLFMMLTFLTTASLSPSGELGSTAEASPGPLRVMSFNLRYAANDSQPWEKRRPVTKNLILEHKPDVIGTQEGLHRQILDLENDLPGYGRIGVGREGGSLGEYMAIFYNTERLKPLEQSHFWLSDTPQTISSASWGNQIPRMATWVRFQDLQNGKTFYMVNTHLDHQSEVSRQKSAELIVDKMKAFASDIPVVITGDFNTRPGSDTYSIATGCRMDMSPPRNAPTMTWEPFIITRTLRAAAVETGSIGFCTARAGMSCTARLSTTMKSANTLAIIIPS